jgi:hypothetical protein
MEHIPNEYVTEERHCRNQKGPQDNVREYFNRLLVPRNRRKPLAPGKLRNISTRQRHYSFVSVCVYGE